MANYPVTLPGSNISPLILNERAQGPGDFTIRYQIPYSVLSTSGASASGDTTTVTLGTTPQNWVVTGLLADVPVAFAGGPATVSATIGTTTTATAFASAFSLTATGVYVPPNGTGSVATPGSANGTSALSMTSVISYAGAGSPTSFTSGFLTILLGVFDPTQIP